MKVGDLILPIGDRWSECFDRGLLKPATFYVITDVIESEEIDSTIGIFKGEDGTQWEGYPPGYPWGVAVVTPHPEVSDPVDQAVYGTEKPDVIAAPPHYTGHPSGIEPIQITKYESFVRGNIIKYVMRAPYKGSELEDLRKARQYLDWEIERLENESKT